MAEKPALTDAKTAELDEVEQRIKAPKVSRFSRIGWAVTALYLILLVVYWASREQSPLALEPNEFGDFLAGVFAPLAFLWLVLGFFQQGSELRNSADALWLQMRELRNSVEQQKGLVEATRDLRQAEADIHAAEQAELERSSLPILTIVGGGGSTNPSDRSTYKYWYTISNAGKPCTDLRVYSDDRLLKRHPSLETGQSLTFTILASYAESVTHRITLRYFDARNVEREEIYEIRTGRDNQSVQKLPQPQGA